MKRFLIAFFVLLSLTLPLTTFAQGEFNPCSAKNTTSKGVLSTGCNTTNFGSILGLLINFIFVIAVILALGFLVFGGIKWITSGGDKGGVEGARNTIIASIIGLTVIVLSYFILNLLILPFLGLGNGFADLQITPITGGGTNTGVAGPDNFGENTSGNQNNIGGQ